jgi:nucleoside-diphosphate-sugar epimerase
MELVRSVEKEVEWVEGDMTDYESLERAIEGVQAVIHAAALVAFTKKEHKRMLKVNAYGTRDLVNLALEKAVNRFIYISSISSLGRNPDKPYINEESNFTFGKLDTGYGVSKHLGEMEVWRGGAEGLSIAIINPALILGSGFWDAGTCKVFKHAYNGLPFYPLGSSAFVDVRDTARMTHQLLLSNIAGERFICAAETTDQKSVLEQICRHFDKKPPKFKLNPFIGSIAVWLESIRSCISGSEPVITKETIRVANYRFKYRILFNSIPARLVSGHFRVL